MTWKSECNKKCFLKEVNIISQKINITKMNKLAVKEKKIKCSLFLNNAYATNDKIIYIYFHELDLYVLR